MTTNKFTQEELLAITKDHKEHITSIGNWNTYRKDKNLPHSNTLVAHFKTWNAFKEAHSLTTNSQSRPLKYTDEELYAILDEHKSHYTSGTNWDKFAMENNLPKHFLFLERLGPDILHEKTGLTTSWDKKKITDTILKHFPSSPPTVTEWNALQKHERLPDPKTVSSYFGSWRQMKYEVYRHKTLED